MAMPEDDEHSTAAEKPPVLTEVSGLLPPAAVPPMKTYRRRWLGAALIGMALLTSWLLISFKVFPMKLISSETFGSITNANNGNLVTAANYEVHMPLWFEVVYVSLIGLGLLLLLLPERNKTGKGNRGF